MSVKQKVEAGFQLVAKDFHTGGLIIDKAIDGVVNALNKMDLNKDGISDIAEYAPGILKLLPKLSALWNLVDTETLVQVIQSSPIFKKVDNAQVQTLVADIAAAFNELEAQAAPAPTTTVTPTKAS